MGELVVVMKRHILGLPESAGVFGLHDDDCRTGCWVDGIGLVMAIRYCITMGRRRNG